MTPKHSPRTAAEIAISPICSPRHKRNPVGDRLAKNHPKHNGLRCHTVKLRSRDRELCRCVQEKPPVSGGTVQELCVSTASLAGHSLA